jgi:enterochelin esterase-like enzyme
MGNAGGAHWGTDAVTFRLADPEHRLAGVRLVQHAGVPADRLAFDRDGDEWVLGIAPPAAWRLEYQLELRHPDGGTETVCDPGNPQRVGGAFGDKSVVHRPDYAAPAWLDRPMAGGGWHDLTVPAPALRSELWARIWSPHGAGDRILVAHDGPEFDKLADLGHHSAAAVASGALPPHHLVLLAPGERNEWYSANPAYASTLANTVLPRVLAELGVDGSPVVGMGASLGALAMLHAQRRFPSAFAGLFLQSGSFFRPRLDPQESGFPWFPRIVRFTGPVVASAFAAHPVPTVLTCGTVEENLANNREMARALARQGYPARLFEVPDGHHFTAWRDALDPYLTDLLRAVWRADAPHGV